LNYRREEGKALMPMPRDERNRRTALMPRYRRLIAVLWQCVAMLLAVPALAAPNHIAAELVAESTVNGTTTLAFHMRPEPGWHGYWSNPGDAGFGMAVAWALPNGAKAGELLYPVPQTLLISGLMNHVYEQDYAVLVPLVLPDGVAAGTVLPVSVKTEWLACTDKVCVPERATLQTTIKVGAQPDPRFDTWRAKLPAPLGSKAQFSASPQVIRIGIPLPASLSLESPHFFIGQDRLFEYAAPQSFSRKGDLLIVELVRKKLAPLEPATISGVLRLNGAGDGVIVSADPGTVPMGGEPLVAAHTNSASLPALLLAALLGGLLLNVMPCVFPILSLKALSLARAGESETEARTEGLAYSAGVVLACTALGALLLALRAGGNEVGWAFQLQEPGVVAALLLLAVAITANLLGLFEFAIPGFVGAANPKGAFATGLLAAFVATPCTGPFMAAAMGAALLLPVPSALALFAALGLGIALPFLAIAFIPALRRLLPRPGGWMATFRRWMAVPMGLTAAALLWLASRLGGVSFAIWCLIGAAILIANLTMIGRNQRKGMATSRFNFVQIAALLVFGAIMLPRAIHTPSAEAQGILSAQPFSEAALAKARATGKPVFLYFTADWCLTCKVNEGVGIETEATRDAFAKAGVIVLRGDWTRRDPAITRFLTARGVAGVPLYLWYPAGGEARQLGQVLGPETLIEQAGMAGD
jgi:DsbC/DsbD-like thiol-disulfide interchange protein/cytochrome c biogenesis protein CcdA